MPIGDPFATTAKPPTGLPETQPTPRLSLPRFSPESQGLPPAQPRQNRPNLAGAVPTVPDQSGTASVQPTLLVNTPTPIELQTVQHTSAGMLWTPDAVIPTERMRLSYSMISTWQRCRFAWHLQYEQGFTEPMPDQTPGIGVAVHACFESVLSGGTLQAGLDTFQEKLYSRLPMLEGAEAHVEEQVQSIVTEARRIAERGLAFLNLDMWETVTLPDGRPAVEFELEAPVPGFHSYIGKIDWVAREIATGYVWLFEFKSRKDKLQPDDSEQVDLQKASYQYLLKRAGIHTNGSITFQMKQKAPAWPKTNQNGTIARSKIATDWATYRAAVVEAGQDPNDYLDMQVKLDTDFYRLTPSFRSDVEVQNAWDQIVVPAAEEMSWELKRIYRTMNHFTCGFCKFRQPCLALLCDHDADYLFRNLYTRYVPPVRPPISNVN